MKRSNLIIALISLLVDVTTVFAGFLLAYYLRSGGTEIIYFWPFSRYLTFVLSVMPIWIVLFASQGLYAVRVIPRGWTSIGKLLIGLVSGWGALLIILYLWRSPEAQAFPRLIIIYGILATALFSMVGRTLVLIIVGWLYALGIGTTKTVVIVQNGKADFALHLSSQKGRGRDLVEVLHAPKIIEQLKSLNKSEKFDEIIVASPNFEEEALLELLNWAEDNNKSFALVPSLLSVRATNVEIGNVAGTPVTFFLRTPLEGWRRILKRITDVVISLIGMIIVSPLLLIAYLMVKLGSRGPAIFRQPRVGQDGRAFYVHKFRSMYADADKRFPQFKGWSNDEDKDPRITPVGRFLRKSNIDELPQLWDIFIGRMSVVGPRPEQPKYVEKFSKEMPEYLRRHFVKAGLTGWAQVNGLRGDTSVEERVKYDLYYIEHWSIWFDFRIILATMIMLLKQLFGVQR